MEAGIVTANDGPLKILGNGDISVALNIKATAWSKSAQAKIEAAGGTISQPERKTSTEASDSDND